MSIIIHVTDCLFIITTRNPELLTRKKRINSYWFQDHISPVISKLERCRQCAWCDNKENNHQAITSLITIAKFRYYVSGCDQWNTIVSLKSIALTEVCGAKWHTRSGLQETKAHISGLFMDPQTSSILPVPKRKNQFSLKVLQSYVITVAFSYFFIRTRHSFS